MNNTTKTCIIILILLCSNICYAQYDYMKIKLSAYYALRRDKDIEFELYQKKDSSYLKVNRVGQASEIDTLYTVSRAKFNEISQMALSLSATDILYGMNPDNPLIWNDGMSCVVEIGVFSESIKYVVRNPSSETDKRRLRAFVQLCKEIILTAKMNPKKIL